jgi:hypothetical protein
MGYLTKQEMISDYLKSIDLKENQLGKKSAALNFNLNTIKCDLFISDDENKQYEFYHFFNGKVSSLDIYNIVEISADYLTLQRFFNLFDKNNDYKFIIVCNSSNENILNFTSLKSKHLELIVSFGHSGYPQFFKQDTEDLLAYKENN